MKMTSPEDLFLHELQDMYYAEKALVATLPKLAEEAGTRELKRAFTSHLRETKKHVKNLERVFESIGEKAEGKPCPGIDGIRKEHDEFVREHGATDGVMDVFLTGAAARAEHYEIAAYTGLLSKARALKQRDAVKLLQENLRQEKEALRTMEGISKRLLEKTANGSRSAAKRSR